MEKWYQLIHHYLETNLTQLKTKDAGIMDRLEEMPKT